MRTRPFALSALLLFAIPATALAQEPVLLRLGGVPGRAIQGRTVITVHMSGGPFAALGTDTAQPTLRLHAFVTRTLDAVAGDTLTFTTVLDSARAESPALPQLSATMQGAIDAAPKRSTVRTDSRGRIVAFDTTAMRAASTLAASPLGRAGGGGFGPEGPGCAFPEHPVRVGESWTETAAVAVPSGDGSARGQVEYRLQRIDPRGSAGTAVISMSGVMSLPVQGMPMEAPIAGIFRLDLAERRVTATALTIAYAVSTPAGDASSRIEIMHAELGDSAPPPPIVRRAVATALPGTAAPAAPPRPAAPTAALEPPADPADTLVGVEISPAPARFTVVRLGTPAGQLNALLAEHVRRARAAGRRPYVEFEADWCGPCRALQRQLGDHRMVEAFDGTYVVKVNLDRWQARLVGTGFNPTSIPVFFELDDAGKPTGRQLDGGAWGEDVPENMAPPLKAFFHAGARANRS